MSQPNPIEIQKYLSGVDYPVTKQNLLDKASENGAGEDVLAALERLPERDYNGPNAVSAEVTKA
ncbi:DUF2795 domain-containing protein [Lentzea rhizosphaerae]|uniref:DUF2795 domain-containing protein n=1 Tax=Lentzea rhizosphaerae TaxID=2041025 RepID=A0ABV8C2E2_9PSEU